VASHKGGINAGGGEGDRLQSNVSVPRQVCPPRWVLSGMTTLGKTSAMESA
jgi:hypothetical protein